MALKDGKYIGFYVTQEDYKKLRGVADVEQCVTVNRLVREVIDKIIREHEKK